MLEPHWERDPMSWLHRLWHWRLYVRHLELRWVPVNCFQRVLRFKLRWRRRTRRIRRFLVTFSQKFWFWKWWHLPFDRVMLQIASLYHFSFTWLPSIENKLPPYFVLSFSFNMVKSQHSEAIVAIVAVLLCVVCGGGFAGFRKLKSSIMVHPESAGDPAQHVRSTRSVSGKPSGPNLSNASKNDPSHMQGQIVGKNSQIVQGQVVAIGAPTDKIAKENV